MIEAFSEYISDVLHLGRYPVSAIASPCEPESTPESDTSTREPYAWDLGWANLFAFITKNFSVVEEAYCQNEADIELAATWVLQCLAKYMEKTLSGDDAIAFAERVMQRTRDEYAQLLLMLWKANEHAVLFATQRQGESLGRIGLSVMAPVTEEFYGRFRRGEAEDSDITQADLLRVTKCVLHDAIAENWEGRRRVKAGWSMALMRTAHLPMRGVVAAVAQGEYEPPHHHVWRNAGNPQSDAGVQLQGNRGENSPDRQGRDGICSTGGEDGRIGICPRSRALSRHEGSGAHLPGQYQRGAAASRRVAIPGAGSSRRAATTPG